MSRSHPKLPALEIDPDWSILEVGSGPHKVFPNSVALDVSETCHPDVVHDLNDMPYPLAGDSFDLVV